MEYEWILIGLALAFGFYMAWSIGANDVANAMGTSVGSGALTLKRAVIIAAILEFAGAYLVGMHVTDTVRGDLIDLTIFEGEGQAIYLVCGMLASLLAAGAWLQLASYFGWPVSTTHSIVGAIVGFGVVAGGVGAVDWGVLSGVVGSWIVTPLIAGALAFIIFKLVLRFVFYAPSPVDAARKVTPILVFFVFFVMTLVTVYKGLKNLNLDLSGPQAIGVATAVGLLGSAIGWWLASRLKPSEPMTPDEQLVPEAARLNQRSLEKAIHHLRRVQISSEGQEADEVGKLLAEVRRMAATNRAAASRAEAGGTSQYRDVERVFIYLQILSAAFVAFAHGANDVANAIGPLSAVVQTVQAGAVVAQSAVPGWALLIGGAGIVVGLATWGWRVIQTIGSRITELTPSRGFAAEFAAATTIVIASRFGLPISTTQTLVGAVLGVGFARGISALNLNTVRDIVASWIITIPAGAGLSILFYYVLVMIFA